MKSKDTSWSNVAGWYDEMLEQSPDSYQAKVILPNIIRLADPKPGMTILDLACGQGYFSRAFAEKGAQVIGCDISKELIERAKKHSPAGIQYHVAPANKLSFMADHSADAVTIILALQNIEDIAGTLVECSRILKPEGKLFIVINHPAFRIPGNSSWQWDEKGNKQYRRIDAYMSDAQNKIDMTPGEPVAAKKTFTTSFHRPLQSYFKAIGKAGFAVTRLEEWISHKKSQKGPRGDEEDRIRKEIPMFVCVEGKRVS